jgi:uncharacterized protein (TIGR00730 family)
MGEVAKTFVSLSTPEIVEGIIPRALIKTEKDPSTRGDSNASLSSETKQAEKTMSKADLQKVDSRRDTDEMAIPVSEFGRTTIVKDMHTRKRLMAERVRDGGHGSGFVALAGGYGTIEEVMEMVTWNQLGIHKLPIVLVNINGYWDGLLQWVRKSIDEGFVGKGNADILVEVKDPSEVASALLNYKVAAGRFNLDWTRD